jgi:glycosyltransferase involved in cell wall biosynthesis
MIFLDTTNAAGWRHASGLNRVSRKLAHGLGAAAVPLSWAEFRTRPGAEDWILTPELFSEAERPGLAAFLAHRRPRLAAIYHDSIPLKFPAITWPASVARHPAYLKLLSQFDRVWAVSEASRAELLQFWRWQGARSLPPVSVLALGADGLTATRETAPPRPVAAPYRVVAIGILEPRKNQSVLLDAFEILGREGVTFELHLVGRVNPHFGAPLARRVQELAARTGAVFHHAKLKDRDLVSLLRTARCSAFPSLAEGCGLPVLESLWMGVPCVCSDIAAVQENAANGGCQVVAGNSLEGWCQALRRILRDDALHADLARQAGTRPLPTWSEAAETVRRGLAIGTGLPS